MVYLLAYYSISICSTIIIPLASSAFSSSPGFDLHTNSRIRQNVSAQLPIVTSQHLNLRELHTINSYGNRIRIRPVNDYLHPPIYNLKSVRLRSQRPLLEEDDIITDSENNIIATAKTETETEIATASPKENEAMTLFDSDPSTTTVTVTAPIQQADPEDQPSYVPILILCWFVALLSALDRVAMSVAILPMGNEYHLLDTTKGSIASFFSVGYGLTIIPCGLLLSTSSPRTIMAYGVGLWSLATFSTPLAASLIHVVPTLTAATTATTAATATYAVENVGPLLAVRATMGAAESVVIPTVQTILAGWVPKERKSLAVATVFSGFQTGTVCAYFLSPWVMDDMGGWRGLFYVYGLVGVVWLLPWLAFAEDRPKVGQTGGLLVEDGGDGSIVDVDVDVDVVSSMGSDVVVTDQMPNLIDAITGNDNDTTTTTPTNDSLQSAIELFQDAPWAQLLTSKAVWGMTIAHAANNWGLYNFLSWTPTFYSEQYSLNIKDSALLSILPSVAGALCGLLAGSLADTLITSLPPTATPQTLETRRTLVRRTFQGIALLGPAACLFTLASHIPDRPVAAQALLTGTIGLQAFNAAGYGAAAQEKAGGKWAGLLYSLTSLPGVLFGSLGVYVTGQILDATGQDWSSVFGINGAVDVLGGLAFILLYDSKKEFD